MRFRRHRPVSRFRRPLADQDLGTDMGFAPAPCARPWYAQRPSRAQAGRQLAAQRAAALYVERLVDGLVADAHGFIVREVEPQALGDLLRAPRLGPAPVLPGTVPPALPGHGRPGHRGPARGSNHASQPVLHIRPQRRASCKLRRLRAPGGPFSMPLRDSRPVVQAAAARRGVAPQLPRDRRRRPPCLPGDLPYARALRTQDRKLLSFGKRQVSPGKWLC